MKQFLPLQVAIRHVGMLTMFDKVVEKEGEEKVDGDIAKTLSRSIKLLLRSRF